METFQDETLKELRQTFLQDNFLDNKRNVYD